MQPILDVSHECADLISRLLETDQSKRISMEEIFSHPFFVDHIDARKDLYEEAIRTVRNQNLIQNQEIGNLVKKLKAKLLEEKNKNISGNNFRQPALSPKQSPNGQPLKKSFSIETPKSNVQSLLSNQNESLQKRPQENFMRDSNYVVDDDAGLPVLSHGILGKNSNSLTVPQFVVNNTGRSAYFGETQSEEMATEKKSLLNSKDMQDLFQGLESNEDLDFLDEINNTVTGANSTKKLSPILADSVQLTESQNYFNPKFELSKKGVSERKNDVKFGGNADIPRALDPIISSNTVPYSKVGAKNEIIHSAKNEAANTKPKFENFEESELKNRNPWNKNKNTSSPKASAGELKAQPIRNESQNLMFSFGGDSNFKPSGLEKPKELKRKNTKEADPLLRQLSDSVHMDLDIMSENGYNKEQDTKGKRIGDDQEYDYFSEQNIDGANIEPHPKKELMNFHFQESEEDSFNEQIKSSLNANSKLFKSEVKEKTAMTRSKEEKYDRTKPNKARRATVMEEDYIDTRPVQYQFTEEDKANKIKLNPESINQILNSNTNDDM
jgi:hypothetical protein